ncbi:MAG: VOC family protein [Opitutaceae bacterium]
MIIKTLGEFRNIMPPELVIPMLVCKCASAEIEFCKAAFGAVELSRRTAQNGDVLHAALKIGAAMIMVHGEVPTFASRAPQMDGSSSVVIYLYMRGVDTVIDRAVGAGARLLLRATNASWGDRVGRVVDPEGHVWNIATRNHEKDA